MRCGFIAVVGRPSVGKSTLVNALCGEKVAIASPVPQTTRNMIRGVVNVEEGQIVFTDTPGFHDSGKMFNRRLMSLVASSLHDADGVLYVMDATRVPGQEEEGLVRRIAESGKDCVVALNKVDVPGTDTGVLRAFLLEHLGGADVLEVSALEGENLGGLVELVMGMVPEGPLLYPESMLTDQSRPFRVGEVIREQAFLRVSDEVPHSLYVDVADFEERDSGGVWVRAFILVERSSQVGILVGKGGVGVRAIRVESERVLGRMFGCRVRLDLRVKVQAGWRSNSALVGRLVDPGNLGEEWV